jgi:hypothetical protein
MEVPLISDFVAFFAGFSNIIINMAKKEHPTNFGSAKKGGRLSGYSLRSLLQLTLIAVGFAAHV